MVMQLKATDVITKCDGVPCRVWEGVTEGGVHCNVFVHHLSASNRQDTNYLEEEMYEELPISRVLKLHQIH